MKFPFLILDSGGTSTKCALVTSPENMEFFETKSYHPSQFSSTFFTEMKQFWGEKTNLKPTLYFYGAGCSSKINQEIISSHFTEFGFSVQEVESDIFGACLAAFGEKSGITCILGTGSVLARFEGGKIKQQLGGKGYLLGDEGSGYYFGKLICKDFLSGKLSKEQLSNLPPEFYTREELLKAVYSETGKAFMASIPSYIHESKLFDEYHLKNLLAFFEDVKQEIAFKNQNLALFGSYGLNQEENIREILKTYEIKKISFHKNPLKLLVNRQLKKNEK
jgi:glucosamine kinase